MGTSDERGSVLVVLLQDERGSVLVVLLGRAVLVGVLLCHLW
jgi:hypothetical protein